MKRFDLARLGYKSILGGEMKIITYIIPFIFMIMSSTSLASTDSLFFHKMTCEDAFDESTDLTFMTEVAPLFQGYVNGMTKTTGWSSGYGEKALAMCKRNPNAKVLDIIKKINQENEINRSADRYLCLQMQSPLIMFWGLGYVAGKNNIRVLNNRNSDRITNGLERELKHCGILAEGNLVKTLNKVKLN